MDSVSQSLFAFVATTTLLSTIAIGVLAAVSSAPTTTLPSYNQLPKTVDTRGQMTIEVLQRPKPAAKVAPPRPWPLRRTATAGKVVVASPVEASSGDCAGLQATALAKSFGGAFHVVVDPLGWCQLLENDARRVVRYSPEFLVTWPLLATDSYFTTREPGIGRDAVTHAGGARAWSEIALLLPGGRHYIVSSYNGVADARRLARVAVQASPTIDPVSLSAGNCFGEMSALDLALLTGSVFRVDGSLHDPSQCLLVSESGDRQLVAHHEQIGSEQSLQTTRNWSEVQPGIGRSAVYRPPTNALDLHGIAFLVGTREYEVYAGSRADALAFGQRLLPLLKSA